MLTRFFIFLTFLDFLTGYWAVWDWDSRSGFGFSKVFRFRFIYDNFV